MTIQSVTEGQLRQKPANSLTKKLPGEYIWPAYSQHLTIANLAATVAALLGKEIGGEPPLPDALWHSLRGGTRRVILFTVDALGYLQLQRHLSDFPDSPWHEIVNRGLYVPLTSVVPSTTTAALTSINSGYPPGQHGMVGYQLFLRQYGMVFDSIFWYPVGGHNLGSMQTIWGLDPKTFLMTPNAVQHYRQQGIRTGVHIWFSFRESALSTIHYQGSSNEVMGAVTMADMAVQLRQELREPLTYPTAIFAYWHTIDGSAHTYGPNKESWQAELEAIGRAIVHELLHKVSAQETVLIITADHGQISTPPESAVYLSDHPVLAHMLLLPPTGDSRTTYLYARQGLVDDVIAYINGNLSNCFLAVPTTEALSAKLFGADVSPETQTRLGDVVVFALAQCIFAKQRKNMLGRHGGLSPEEMLVPYIAFRL